MAHTTLEAKSRQRLEDEVQHTLFKNVDVDGINVFYREAGQESSPKLVLLHGFPASSHQYRNLLPALSNRFHVIAPDYPGFGNSEMPNPAKFAYTLTRRPRLSSRFLGKSASHISACMLRTTEGR